MIDTCAHPYGLFLLELKGTFKNYERYFYIFLSFRPFYLQCMHDFMWGDAFLH